jgi:hypothetical protein
MNKQRKLPQSLTIVASYLIIAGTIGLVLTLLTLTGLLSNPAEFQAQSLGYRLGAQSRVTVFNLLYLVAGIGLFLRKPWAYKLALITILVSTFYSVYEFAWGFAGGKPPLKVYVLATIVMVLWDGFWIYLIYRGKAAAALQSKNEMDG